MVTVHFLGGRCLILVGAEAEEFRNQLPSHLKHSGEPSLIQHR